MIKQTMIQRHQDDDDGFIDLLCTVLQGAIHTYKPLELYLLKVNNWFGDKWVCFTGKVMGELGVHQFKPLTLPPFVPSRILDQQHYYRETSTDKTFLLAPASPLHITQTSSQNFTRSLKEISQIGVFLWYSGATSINGRGSIMVYWTQGEMAFGWYCSAIKNITWKIERTQGIPYPEFLHIFAVGKKLLSQHTEESGR